MKSMRVARIVVAPILLSAASLAGAAILHVGPGQPYATPCAAIAAAPAGSTIQIDAAGNYNGDVCGWSTNGLTLQGMNGRAHIDAAGNNSGGKAIWVIAGDDTTVDNIELSGCTVPVLHSYFHDNQDGILAGDLSGSAITIEYSEFANKGAGDGQTHNLYINHIDQLVFKYNWSHQAIVGHLLKTRARQNFILYNRLTGEANGSESYEVTMPSGGVSYVIGNLIEQPATTQNSAMLDYLSEPASANPDNQLFVVNNTFVNDRSNGTFMQIDPATSVPIVARNNIFFGPGTICTQSTPAPILDHNYSGVAPMFVDIANFNYRLQPGSPAIDAGIDPGSGAGQSLVPVDEYQHPTASVPRIVSGILDIGAYEFDDIFKDGFGA
jgi:hypothetical protein